MGAKSNPRQHGQSPRALTHQVTVHTVGDGVPPTLPSGTGNPKGIAQAELPAPAGQCTCRGRQDPGSFPGLPSLAQHLHPKPGSAKLGVQADVPLGMLVGNSGPLHRAPPNLNPSLGHRLALYTPCLCGVQFPTRSPHPHTGRAVWPLRLQVCTHNTDVCAHRVPQHECPEGKGFAQFGHPPVPRGLVYPAGAQRE